MNVAGVILAGGKSRRMGIDKAYLKISEQTFLEKAKSVLTDLLGAKQVFISGREDEQAIYDVNNCIGPIGGIFSSLVYLNKREFSYVLIIPVDMPFLTKDILGRLLQVIQDNINLECLYYNNCYLPMAIKISNHVISVVEKSIAKERYGLFEVVRYLKTHSILDENLRDVLSNINTYVDYLRLPKTYSFCESIN